MEANGARAKSWGLIGSVLEETGTMDDSGAGSTTVGDDGRRSASEDRNC